MRYTTKRNLSLTLSVIFLAGALVVFFVLDWPIFKKIGELNKKINQEQTQYENQYKAVEVAKSIINQYKSLLSVSQTISLSIPRDPEVQNLLAQLENITTQSGLALQNINFENIGATLPQSQKDIVKSYRTLRLTLGLLGNYESFKTWLGAIENNIRLMDVVKITFTGLSSEAQKTTGLFNFKVILNVYYQ